jgi:hypothetical protein
VNDVEAFEVHPHWVGRVGEPAACKCVGREQIAKLIVDYGLRHVDQERYGCATE